MVFVDAFDAVHFEAVNKENAEMRRIFLFRFDLTVCACCLLIVTRLLLLSQCLHLQFQPWLVTVTKKNKIVSYTCHNNIRVLNCCCCCCYCYYYLQVLFYQPPSLDWLQVRAGPCWELLQQVFLLAECFSCHSATKVKVKVRYLI